MRNLIRKLLILTFFSCNTPSANQDIPGLAQKQTVTTISETPAPSKADSTLSFDRYCNARFGYCIEYPRGIAVPQPQPTNGDGRIFLNPQGQEVLRVYGRNNTDPDFGNISLEQQFRNDIRHVKEEKDVSESKITYQKLGKNFFVISGYSRGKLFYQKTILRDEDFAYAILRWASDDTALFRKISNRIFQSFQ